MCRQTGWVVKRVGAKEEPSTLIATDGTVCTVTPGRFERVELRTRIACHWTDQGRPVAGRQ